VPALSRSHAAGFAFGCTSRTVAGGASGRNGALRCAVVPWRTTSPAPSSAANVPERYGADGAHLDLMASLAGDALRRVGSLRLAADDAERDALAAEHAALRKTVMRRVLDVLRRRRPVFRGAILHRATGRFSLPLVRRLARQAADAGAEIVGGDLSTWTRSTRGRSWSRRRVTSALCRARGVVWPVRARCS